MSSSLKGNINSFLIINLWGFAQLLPSIGSLRRAYGKGDAFCIALSSFNDFYNVSVLLRNSEQKENWISTEINVEAGAVQVASIVFWPCCKA
ncbi:unnamed protein product [Camellia sinensis]